MSLSYSVLCFLRCFSVFSVNDFMKFWHLNIFHFEIFRANFP